MRFLMWAVTATVAGILILKHAPTLQDVYGNIPYTGISIALFVLGPLAFAAQLLRMALVTVMVDPQTGVILRNGQQVSWQEIDGVDYVGLRFVTDQVIIHALLDAVRALTDRIPGFGLMSVLKIGLIAIIGGLILILAIISGVLLPVMLLLSPWEPRVVVRTKDGRRMVWRDLIREADFVHSIEKGLRRAGQNDPAPAVDISPD